MTYGIFFWFKNNRSSGDQWKGLGEVGFGTWGQTEGVQSHVGMRVICVRVGFALGGKETLSFFFSFFLLWEELGGIT